MKYENVIVRSGHGISNSASFWHCRLTACSGPRLKITLVISLTNWLRLSTSQQNHIDVIAAQNDAMAVGAKKALQEFAFDSAARNRWFSIPFLGCDGVPKTGQAWVRSGLLAATVIAPPLAGQGLEMLVHALQIMALRRR